MSWFVLRTNWLRVACGNTVFTHFTNRNFSLSYKSLFPLTINPTIKHTISIRLTKLSIYFLPFHRALHLALSHLSCDSFIAEYINTSTWDQTTRGRPNVVSCVWSKIPIWDFLPQRSFPFHFLIVPQASLSNSTLYLGFTLNSTDQSETKEQ